MSQPVLFDNSIPEPPREFVDVIGGYDFYSIGEHLFRLVVDRCAVTPTDRVLDIGCGVGRVAIPLTRHLQPSNFYRSSVGFVGPALTDAMTGAVSAVAPAQAASLRGGSYDGIDLYKPLIDWCQEHIASRFPNFRFHHADLSNTAYRPNEGQSAETYTFPFPDKSFDVIFALSVFTHLFPKSAARYASEIRRTLKPGGRALLTFLLITDDVKTDGSQTGDFAFKRQEGGYAVTMENSPESVLGVDEKLALKILTDAGLTIKEVSHGTWNGKGGWTYQDVVMVTV